MGAEAPGATSLDGEHCDDAAMLDDHGDRQVVAGALNLAVNVLPDTPSWLLEELRGIDLADYPDVTSAVASVAARHGVPPDHCLLTNGAAEAFWAVANSIRPRLAACVHPSFTAPEAALRAAGVPVHRVVRSAADGFRLDPAAVPEAADLVVLGRPDNPTGKVEPVEVVASLTRPGRVVVVDEAFADFLPDGGTLATYRLPGVLCVRSLTKLWGLAGLRVGYVLGDSGLLAQVARAMQPWPVNSLAAHAALRLSGRDADRERHRRAALVAVRRDALLRNFASRFGDELAVWASPANFVLVRGRAGMRERLLEHGIAVRRGDTFPGLDERYVRLAVPLTDEHLQRLLPAMLDAWQ